MRGVRLALTAALCAALTACGGGGSSPAASGTPTPAPPATPIVAGQLLPANGDIYFGAYPDATGLARGDSGPNVALFESEIGRKLALDDSFLTFNRKFGTRIQQDDYFLGRLPIFSWNCGPTNTAIASGAYDASLKLQADTIRAYGWPVFVNYMYDMNLSYTVAQRRGCYDTSTDNPDGTFSPTQFIAAWTHIHDVFAAEGAVNVVWLWSVSSQGSSTNAYYPGDAYVDWVGIDAFDDAGASLTDTLMPTYQLVSGHGKPIMIAETGASATVQIQFFTGAAATLRSTFPLVKGFVYYNAIGTTADWRVTPASMSAFTTFANDPYVSAFYAAP